MASLRPSAYNQRDREDGGPFLIIQSAESEEGVDVFFTDVPPEQFSSDSLIALLMNICPDKMTIWPINVRQDTDEYLSPKYDRLERIVITRSIVEPYPLPESEDDVVGLLEQLPDGFAKDYRVGLGLLWEYRHICDAVTSRDDVSVLIIQGGDKAIIDPPFFLLGIKRFNRLRRELNSITSRYQRDARSEKKFQTYQSILHAADPEQYPALIKKLRPGTIAEKTNGGRDNTALGPQDRRAVVQLVKDNVKALAKTESRSLLALRSDIELVTLDQLIARYSEMLGCKLTESKWQNFFMDNPFILSLAFAIPVFLVQGQAYAGGKKLNGREGKYTDFVYASAASGNLALVEIKRPETELLSKKPYRGGDVYAASGELSGALTQLLDQRFKLQMTLPVLKMDANLNNIHGFAIRCIIIAGASPTENEHKKSFELVRNAFSEVVVITFDELLQRLIEIRKALSPS